MHCLFPDQSRVGNRHRAVAAKEMADQPVVDLHLPRRDPTLEAGSHHQEAMEPLLSGGQQQEHMEPVKAPPLGLESGNPLDRDNPDRGMDREMDQGMDREPALDSDTGTELEEAKESVCSRSRSHMS